MVAQHFDHPAIGDFPACALHDHAFQFAFQRRQPRKTAFDLSQLRLGDGIGADGTDRDRAFDPVLPAGNGGDDDFLAFGGDTSYTGNLSHFTDRRQVDTYAVTPMTWAVSHEIISGTSDTTLSPLSTATRAQVVVILHRYLTD